MNKFFQNLAFASLLLILSNPCSYSQGNFNKWYFGKGAGLDFNSGTAVPITGSLSTIEGCASACDASGNILFYTNGVVVYNAKHEIMQNGSDLMGHESCSQAALIVGNPDNPNQYYIFNTRVYTVGAFGYSIVDMTLEGGLGAVTSQKNIVVDTAVTECITAVRIPDNVGFWIIGHQPGNNTFFAYKLTKEGLSNIPVLSQSGAIQSSDKDDQGCLKASQKGNKLAITFRSQRIIQVLDFDKTTGVVSNPLVFTLPVELYGVEFSPDGSKLYISDVYFDMILQADLDAKSEWDLARSIKDITEFIHIDGQRITSLQLGPDFKIYVAKENSKTVGVINSPNEEGDLCKYVDDQVHLIPPSMGMYGLPNFFEMVCSTAPKTDLGSDTSLCLKQTLELNGGLAESYLWSTGSKDSSIIVSPPGKVWLKASNPFCSSTDTIAIATRYCNVVVELPDLFTPNGRYEKRLFSTHPV